jgi:hypothetical protein
LACVAASTLLLIHPACDLAAHVAAAAALSLMASGPRCCCMARPAGKHQTPSAPMRRQVGS